MSVEKNKGFGAQDGGWVLVPDALCQPGAGKQRLRPDSGPAPKCPPAVAQELQAVKARMAQMESQLKDLAAFVARLRRFQFGRPAPRHRRSQLPGP